ncbi:restriction endonuclease fold toxin 5 domain-containing protein [Xenorhabdus miraniensis]|uniref:Tox-REase-5 domain-containing protein n=1 Tax=Xenorhabdus miraniensis TaxID=351674 RepID=A0A2D0JW19_9GAMM|nr:restriction endonuclease fold toxin 5 domain-containing protein [Xenorhabdus miraniensis]PHM50533.1 hypothetical protein Xmir_00716 [Xenorhabdus miraniensis]
MPGPLVLGAPAAGSALLAAAEWTLAACVAGLVAVGIMEGTKDKEKTDEKDKAEARTDAISTTREKCDKCPAIGQVVVFWEKCPSYSNITIEYQTRIAGTTYDPALVAIQTWKCQTVNFDGWKPENCLFLEAKALYDQFFKNGVPMDWWKVSKSGHLSMINQAERQQEVCDAFDGIPRSHWHFLQPISFAYYTRWFSIHPNITVFHTI